MNKLVALQLMQFVSFFVNLLIIFLTVRITGGSNTSRKQEERYHSAHDGSCKPRVWHQIPIVSSFITQRNQAQVEDSHNAKHAAESHRYHRSLRYATIISVMYLHSHGDKANTWQHECEQARPYKHRGDGGNPIARCFIGEGTIKGQRICDTKGQQSEQWYSDPSHKNQ